MLEGKEFEQKLGDVGVVSFDVTDKGQIVLELKAGYGVEGLKASSVNTVETDIFVLATAIAKKTATPMDDAAIAGLKGILGIA